MDAPLLFPLVLFKNRLLPAALSYKSYLLNASPTQQAVSVFPQPKKKQINETANTTEYRDGNYILDRGDPVQTF